MIVEQVLQAIADGSKMSQDRDIRNYNTESWSRIRDLGLAIDEMEFYNKFLLRTNQIHLPVYRVGDDVISMARAVLELYEHAISGMSNYEFKGHVEGCDNYLYDTNIEIDEKLSLFGVEIK